MGEIEQQLQFYPKEPSSMGACNHCRTISRTPRRAARNTLSSSTALQLGCPKSFVSLFATRIPPTSAACLLLSTLLLLCQLPGCQKASERAADGVHRPAEDEAADNEAADNEAWYDDFSGAAGIGFQHVSGHQDRCYLPEIMGGGVGLLDYDQDGYLDVYLVQSGSLNRSGPEDS